MVVSGLILGFLGSLHCLGMCGPIAFMLPLNHSNKVQKGTQLTIYHLGRLLAYALLGLVFGLAGKSLQLFGVQQKLSIGIGIIMILLVIIPSQYFAKFSITKHVYGIVGYLKTALGHQLKKRTPDTFLTIGFLNGFLPCGLVYVALFGAIAMGSVWHGSLYMVLFGLGTIPLMSAVVFAKDWVGKHVQFKVKRLIPIFVVVMGCLFILRGMGLGIPYLSPKGMQNQSITAQMECHQP